MKLKTNKIIKLSKEQNDSLSETPFKVAGKVFKELESWRKRSLRSKIRI